MTKGKAILIGLQGIFAGIGGGVAYLLGGLDGLLVTLLALLALDYIAGILCAIYYKQLSSRIGAKGIVKKVGKLLVVGLAFLIEDLTQGAFPLRELVIISFISNEGISILENVAVLGVPFPPKMKEVLIQLKGEKEETKLSQKTKEDMHE